MILDTSFIIDLLRGQPEAVKKAREIEEREVLKTTSITVFEIVKGVNEKESKKVISLINDLIIVLFDTESAVKAGEISRNLFKEGRSIDEEDCMIAGIACVEKDTILTRNKKHFSRIKGLTIEGY